MQATATEHGGAISIRDLGATVTFADNFPATTQTMPLVMYLALETKSDEAIVLSLVMIAISFTVLAGLRAAMPGRIATPR